MNPTAPSIQRTYFGGVRTNTLFWNTLPMNAEFYLREQIGIDSLLLRS
ncbi:MAG: hypothetical protein ACYDEV_16350 [Acidiferrobacter sp.]